MRFCATEFRRDGEYGITLDALDWAAAERECEENGWRLDGELGYIIPATDAFGIPEANAMIEALNEAETAVKH